MLGLALKKQRVAREELVGTQKGTAAASAGCCLLGAKEEGGTLAQRQVARMESWFPGWWAPAGPLMAVRLLRLLLVPWTLQLAGGQSVSQSGPPILVSLANMTAPFGCRITYPYTPAFKDFTVSYFHIDLQGQQSPKKQTTCHAGPGTENQTYTLTCWVIPRLPDASATGTYYCYVHWQSVRVRGSGTFILVRDTGYQHLPPSSRKTLLYGFTGLLAVLSVLGTALLLWKKKQRLVPRKHPTPSCPDPRSASRPTQPAAESAYMALQHRETEVYAYIESKENSPLPAGSPPSQERRQQFEDDREVNLVYENL